MTLLRPLQCAFLLVFSFSTFATITNAQIKPGRDPNQPIDQEYTNKIREYTTEPYFNSPLTDYLPASSDVPTPKAVLGRRMRALPASCRTRKMSTVHAHARACQPACESVFDRHDGRRARDDCGGGRLRSNCFRNSKRTARGSRSSPIRAPSTWTKPKPIDSSPLRFRSTTSPARFTRPKPGRRPR